MKPWQAGTFKLSRDAAFAEKVADVVGLYLDPPGGAVVFSIDEKTQGPGAGPNPSQRCPSTLARQQNRTQRLREAPAPKNLFAALNVRNREFFGKYKQTRNGQDFLDFLKRGC